MERMASMPLGVVVERREIDNEWQDYEWRAVAVIPGAPEIDEPREISRGPGWVHYHATTLPLELHRKETTAYRTSLSDTRPVVHIVMRDDEESDDRQMEPFIVTASSDEALDYMDVEEDLVEQVAMPDGVIAWVQAFIDKHHVDEPFVKRKRKRHGEAPDKFGPSPAAGGGRGGRHG